MIPPLLFPPGFIWGCATSAYQIEGAWNEDGRGPSIWDNFSRQRGRVRGGANGDTATDHYHRWAEDVELMARLGLGAYRFSIAWTRIIPDGKGTANPKGLDFYSRLVDALLEKGITPYPTLFHYDLPQPLQDAGGWPNRQTALRFADYATVVAHKLGDRVENWITHNEPWVAAVLGHLTGLHAPGWHSPKAAFWALHHMLLSHGLAAAALRSSSCLPARVGMALNFSPIYGPSSPSGAHHNQAVTLLDALTNRMVLDPLLRGQYPSEAFSPWWGGLLRRQAQRVSAEDMQIISTPMDFLGINYYTRAVVRRVPVIGVLPMKPAGSEYTSMWEIYPQGLYDLLLRLNRDYHHPNLIILENGAPTPDVLTPDGKVHDNGRIAYLDAHLRQVKRALDAGVPLTGYFAWSLLDNFEWVLGYSQRFGLVYIDYATQKRIPKDSFVWYANVISTNSLPEK